jgi:hypothetical protein
MSKIRKKEVRGACINYRVRRLIITLWAELVYSGNLKRHDHLGELSVGCKIINGVYKNGTMIGFKWLRIVEGSKYVYSKGIHLPPIFCM